MSVYTTLDKNPRQWTLLCDFLGAEGGYRAQVTGDEVEGYRFQYFSARTNYRSDGIYQSKEAADQGLSLALLRSLVYNSDYSVFVVDEHDTVVLQSERNRNNFGCRQRSPRNEITDKKARWETQGAFGFMVYREIED